ncbi:MAG: ABC transporter substrate-binding protein [Alphaproteobacteria bacterium]|nr:ABC transporter substrate-binding protein [Alphaproteobacteria bacterium]
MPEEFCRWARGVVLALAVAGPAAPALAADKVVLQLRWDHQFQFAGYYAAQWQGFYRDAGLEVEIRSAVGPDRKAVKAIEEVMAGRADFDIGAADVLVARDRGSPLLILASIFQRSPTVIVARVETGVSSPADLAGLRVLRFVGDTTDVELQTMLRAEGIDPQTIKPYQANWDGRSFDLLRQGRIDAYAGFSLTANWRARETGLDITTLHPASYGIDFYGDSLFTSEAMAKRDSDLVQRFAAASLQGWRHALDHPKQTAERIATTLRRTYPADDILAFNLFQAEEIKRLTSYPLIELGHTNPRRWGAMARALRQAGLVRREMDAAELIFDPARDAIERATFARNVAWLSAAGISGLLLVAFVWTSLLRRRVTAVAGDLRESEARYRSIFDNAQVGIIRSRISDGKPIEANDRLAEILGYQDREDAVDNHRADNHWIEPGDREAWIAEGKKHGFVRNFDGRLRRKDGRWSTSARQRPSMPRRTTSTS